MTLLGVMAEHCFCLLSSTRPRFCLSAPFTYVLCKPQPASLIVALPYSSRCLIGGGGKLGYPSKTCRWGIAAGGSVEILVALTRQLSLLVSWSVFSVFSDKNVVKDITDDRPNKKTKSLSCVVCLYSHRHKSPGGGHFFFFLIL